MLVLVLPPAPVLLVPAVVVVGVPAVVLALVVLVTAAPPQTPPEQLWPVGQMLPQLPQLFTSVMTLVQTPLHTGEPSLHIQLPAEQVCPAAQTLLQPPQLRGSLRGLVQPPLQSVSPASHCAAQALRLHTSPGAQALLHAPQ